MDPGESMLVDALQFEPELRVALRCHMGLGQSLTSERLETLLQERYARLLYAGQRPAPSTGSLKGFRVHGSAAGHRDVFSTRDARPWGEPRHRRAVLISRNQRSNVYPSRANCRAEDAPIYRSHLAHLVRAIQGLPDE